MTTNDELPILTFNDSASGVALDLDKLIVSRALIQANSGGGKSRALRALLEGTCGRVQHIVFDPEGEFVSLRELFPYVLCGEGADTPAHPSSARVLARRLMELNASAIINLYDLSATARRQFVRYFLEELMSLPRELWRPLLVVIDEAHQYCPERGAGEAESAEAVKTLCSQGRKRGYCAVLATQRLSKLHKDAAAELLNKLIGRTGLDVDVKRASDELGFNKVEAAKLKQLAPGEFFAYGPAISGEVIALRSGDVKTSHPQAGTLEEYSPAPPPAEMREVLAGLNDLPRQAEEEAQTIEKLREKLLMFETAARTGAANRKTEIVEKVVEKIIEVPTPVLADGELERLEEVGHGLVAASKDAHAIGADILAAVAVLKGAPPSEAPDASTHAPREKPREAAAPRVLAPKQNAGVIGATAGARLRALARKRGVRLCGN